MLLYLSSNTESEDHRAVSTGSSSGILNLISGIYHGLGNKKSQTLTINQRTIKSIIKSVKEISDWIKRWI